METIEYRGFTICIKQDDDAVSPREWDNLGTMLCEHRRYNLGDKDAELEDYEDARDDEEIAAELPLFLLDHSGLTLRTFRGCEYYGWDTSRVGVIYVTKKALREWFNVKRISKKTRGRATEVLQAEVEIYDACLTGSVYGYIVEDKDGDGVDSCWGFYGWNHEKSGLLQEARMAIDWMVEEAERKHREANQLAIQAHTHEVKAWIHNHVPLIYRKPLVLPYPGA